jgi:hypothetical protein
MPAAPRPQVSPPSEPRGRARERRRNGSENPVCREGRPPVRRSAGSETRAERGEAVHVGQQGQVARRDHAASFAERTSSSAGAAGEP